MSNQSNTHVIVCVKDTAVQRFAPPMAFPSTPYAIRAFRDEVNKQNGKDHMQTHPEDFELWQIAVWNEESGRFEDNQPQCIARGKDHKEPNNG